MASMGHRAVSQRRMRPHHERGIQTQCTRQCRVGANSIKLACNNNTSRPAGPRRQAAGVRRGHRKLRGAGVDVGVCVGSSFRRRKVGMWTGQWEAPLSAGVPTVVPRASSQGGSRGGAGDRGEARRDKVVRNLERLAKSLSNWTTECMEDVRRFLWIKDSEFRISERTRGVARWCSSVVDDLDRKFKFKMQIKRGMAEFSDRAPRLIRKLNQFSKTPLGGVAGVAILIYLISTGLLFRILNVLFLLTWVTTLAAPFFLRPLVERMQQQQMQQMQQQQGRTQQQGGRAQQNYTQNRRRANRPPFDRGESKSAGAGGGDDGGGIVIDADWKEID